MYIVIIFCRLVGKVAADNGHKWIYSDTQNGCESNYAGPWNASIDHHVRDNCYLKKKINFFIFCFIFLKPKYFYFFFFFI